MAEINYNNLYNQLSPLDKLFYDQQFSKNYAPGQENIMLEMKPGYEQMKAAYEAEQAAKQEISKKSFLDRLNPFSSASAAEMPTVPNLSLGYNMPTFDLGTGITNTTAASPFKIGLSDTLTQYNVPGLRSQNLQEDLVQQIIAENQARTSPFVRPNMLDMAGGIVPGGITEITPSNINLQKLNSLGFGTNYGVANTPDVIGDWTGSDVYEMDNGLAYVIDSKGNRIIAPQKAEYYKQKPSGIAKLSEFLGNIPTPFNLVRRGLESLSGLNQRIQNTDFGQSRTLAEYAMKRRERKQAERAQEAMPEVYRSAKEQGFTNDRGGFSTNRADRAGTSVGSGQFSPSTSRGRSGY